MTTAAGARTAHTACNLCEAICGLVLTLEPGPDGREHVTGVRGNPDDPLSRGHICPKGVAIADVYDDPDRLRRPLVRQPDGTLAETSWDEAVRAAVEGLAGVQERHGRDAVAAYLGNPNVHSLGSMTHGTQLVKALGSRNAYSATSVDQLPAQLSAHLLFGHQLLIPIPDLDRTDLFVVLGANPMASNGSLMTVPDFPGRLRELKARGGRMVVLDPRRTETAKAADEHHFVRPGTDAAVLLAMLNVVLSEGLERVPEYVDGVDALRDAVAPFTPELAEQVSGVPGRDHPRAGPRDRDHRAGRGLRPDGRLDAGVRHRLRVGDQLPQHRDRPPRRARRGDVHRPGGRHRGARPDRSRPPRQVPQPGARPARDRQRAARRDAGRRDAHARARARSAGC